MMHIRWGVLLKKHRLDKDKETHSNIKYLCGRGTEESRQEKCTVLATISGIQGDTGVWHFLT